jgi:TolB-like protein/Tfp pilus assembly protein PilF
MPDPRGGDGGFGPDRQDRLDSWKEIAAYLARDVTTVQRWEKKEGLPVHRKIHDKLGSVYAFKAELDAWWQQGSASRPVPGPSPVSGAPNTASVFSARRVGAAVALFAFVLIAAVTWRPRALPAGPIRSLAVMPLVNQSGDPEQAYFVDGMHDALVLQLSKLPRLKVVSRRATSRSDGPGDAVPETVRALGVDAVLDGSVLQVGNAVRITLRLVDARSDGIVWAEAYERPLADVLSLHAAVATEVASQINLQLMPAESQQFAARPRVDPEAYRLALQADFYATKRGDPRFLIQAQRLFERAIEIDPQYAVAHAGLASTLTLQGMWNGSLAPAVVYTPAKALVDRALEIDPNSADAYYALGQIRCSFEWDWPGAETAFGKAAALDRRSTNSRIIHANYLAAVGRLDEALTMSKETVSLAPLVPLAQQELAFDLFLQGHITEAAPLFEEALRLEPTMLSSWFNLAYIELRRGAGMSAAERVEAMRAIVGDRGSPTRLGQIGNILARLGRPDEARSVLEVLRKRGETEFVPHTALGLVHIGLGDTKQALDELERGYGQRDTFLVWLKTLPIFDPLRGHPRFDRLVQRMHFPAS